MATCRRGDETDALLAAAQWLGESGCLTRVPTGTVEVLPTNEQQPEPAPVPSPMKEEPRETGTTSLGDEIERVIHIIMEATGYERDEIEPDMDLRRDLAIRSSRLPLILDAAEREFGIEIELQDFIGLRTVREISRRIAEYEPGSGIRSERSQTVKMPKTPTPETSNAEPIGTKRVPPTRLVFERTPLIPGRIGPVPIAPGEKLAVLFVGDHSSSTLTKDTVRFFQSKMKLQTVEQGRSVMPQRRPAGWIRNHP